MRSVLELPLRAPALLRLHLSPMLSRQLRSPSARSPFVLHRARTICSSSPAQTTLSIKAALERANTSTTEGGSEEITLNGWVRSCRRQKHVSFAVLNDGSNAKGIQAVLPKGMEVDITVGCSASLRGTLVDSPGKGQAKEFRAAWVEVLGQSDAASYPIQNTKQGVPAVVLRRNAHLRPRANATASMMRMRSEMAWATHEHFRNNEFLQVQAPLITSSDCEGAGEVFRVESGSAPIPLPSASSSDAPPPPPPPPRFLTVSSQLHLEAMAASFSKVYTLSPAFRAERSDTARHLQEFYMLEAEVAFLPVRESEGLESVMKVAEDVVRSVVRHLLEHNSQDIAFFDEQTPGLLSSLETLLASPPFPRITYTEAIDILAFHSTADPTAFAFPPVWGNSIATEHEKWLAESYAHGPIFVTDYPTPLKPFYMLVNPLPLDPSRQTSACFDLLVPRLGELAGGSLREYREVELVDSMERNGVKQEDYDWYTELRRYGTTRHGGFGMGWERLVAFVTGLDNVRDCIAFPRAAEGSRF